MSSASDQTKLLSDIFSKNSSLRLGYFFYRLQFRNNKKLRNILWLSIWLSGSMPTLIPRNRLTLIVFQWWFWRTAKFYILIWISVWITLFSRLFDFPYLHSQYLRMFARGLQLKTSDRASDSCIGKNRKGFCNSPGATYGNKWLNKIL